MKNYWILVDAKKNVMQHVAGGFAQACHGKSHPLRRMHVGDGLIYYSPKQEYGGELICQRFTAIGCIVGEEVYRSDSNDKQAPYRRQARYVSCRDTSIVPLVSRLAFLKEKERWGGIFKFDLIHIPAEDFELIARSMNIVTK